VDFFCPDQILITGNILLELPVLILVPGITGGHFTGITGTPVFYLLIPGGHFTGTENKFGK